MVQSAGRGWRRYTHALFTQIAQNAACNLHRSLEQRLCWWLLVSTDRHGSSTLATAHERLAKTPEVRREGVTDAAGRLRANGLIKGERGQITVIDRAGLQRRVCECYGVLRKERDRLLGGRTARGPGARSLSSFG